MDIEKLIESVRLCGSTPKVDQCKQCAYWSGGDMSKCIPRMTTDAADVAPVVHGEWINALGNYQVAECSNCSEWFEPCPEESPNKDFFECFCEAYSYCPHCGAKMEMED